MPDIVLTQVTPDHFAVVYRKPKEDDPSVSPALPDEETSILLASELAKRTGSRSYVFKLVGYVDPKDQPINKPTPSDSLPTDPWAWRN